MRAKYTYFYVNILILKNIFLMLIFAILVSIKRLEFVVRKYIPV